MFLIVIHQSILDSLGLTAAEISDLRDTGLPAGVIVASCFSFNAGGEVDEHGATQSERFKTVADPDPMSRSLLLVGISDRYGAATRFAGWVKEIGVTPDQRGPRPLTEVERDRLDQCLWGVRDPSLAPLRAALRRASDAESTAAKQSRIKERRTIVVTRHKALVQLLQELGHVGADVTVIEHATEESVSGQHVIGILPMRLAALCATYAECSLVLEEQDRGISDLPIERLRKIAQPLTEYRVRRVEPAARFATITAQYRSILDVNGCEIEHHGQSGRMIVNRSPSRDASQYDLLAIRRRCRAALESAGHDVSDLRIGSFGPFPGN